MEREQSSRQLPEHLVENIIARMPFPSIFKSRTLSKAWLARFSYLESDQGGGKARVAENFQKLVNERSSTWQIFGPVCVDHGRKDGHADRRVAGISHEKSYAYNGACQTWQRIPSLSFIPRASMYRTQSFTAEGALVFWSSDVVIHYHGGPRKRSSTEEFYVANILTGNCKLLPYRLPILESIQEEIVHTRIVINTALQKYEVVLFVQSFHSASLDLNGGMLFDTEFGVQIFDSTSCSWRNKKLVGLPKSEHWLIHNAVYFNGALYSVAGIFVTRLAAFDMEEETWTDISILENGQNAIGGRYVAFSPTVVICDSNLFIIHTIASIMPGSDLFIRLLQVDLSLGTLEIVTVGPPSAFNLKSDQVYGKPVAYGGCIYFQVETYSSFHSNDLQLDLKGSAFHSIGQMPVYNVREKSWSCVSSCPAGVYPGCCFHPGLNPFIAV